MAYFPLFIDLKDKKCLIVGGGQVALRKLLTLLDFDAIVTVVAGDISAEIKLIFGSHSGRVVLIERDFTPSDCEGAVLAVAATDDRAINSRVAKLCREAGIPVNAVDQREDCTFIFPAYVREGNVVAAFSSAGNSPLITQKLKEQMTGILTPLTGQINELLGEKRSALSEAFGPDAAAIYEEIYRACLRAGRVITEEELEEILKKRGVFDNAL